MMKRLLKNYQILHFIIYLSTKKAEKFNKLVIEFYNIDIKDDKKSLKKDYFFNLNRINEIEYFKKT